MSTLTGLRGAAATQPRLRGVKGPSRKRLPREERERLIVREAVAFFAEVGFDGQTRELARRIGITQPLLYRYFPSKDALIDRVYQEAYLNRWNPRRRRTGAGTSCRVSR